MSGKERKKKVEKVLHLKLAGLKLKTKLFVSWLWISNIQMSWRILYQGLQGDGDNNNHFPIIYGLSNCMYIKWRECQNDLYFRYFRLLLPNKGIKWKKVNVFYFHFQCPSISNSWFLFCFFSIQFQLELKIGVPHRDASLVHYRIGTSSLHKPRWWPFLLDRRTRWCRPVDHQGLAGPLQFPMGETTFQRWFSLRVRYRSRRQQHPPTRCPRPCKLSSSQFSIQN